MAQRKVVLEGDEVLRKKSKEVKEINARILSLIDDMWETLGVYNGIGLAAPQVGVLRRIAVIDTGNEGERLELINPKILSTEGVVEEEEACLSLPGYIGVVERPARMTIETMTRDGSMLTITGEGLLAKAMSHEIDHLDGVLFVDKAISVEMADSES
ncbi:MAG: peptide deformylase [Clostridiales Family XIII bacterium]|jgi:peptide deformylase|nr:peptide deformylase [Clostridiales Family XIII bacterium]